MKMKSSSKLTFIDITPYTRVLMSEGRVAWRVKSIHKCIKGSFVLHPWDSLNTQLIPSETLTTFSRCDNKTLAELSFVFLHRTEDRLSFHPPNTFHPQTFLFRRQVEDSQ
jgi:hypothetical protein